MVRIVVNDAWCKKCGICEAFCPKKVFDMEPGLFPTAARPKDCIACGLCEMRCPDFAICVTEEGE